MMPSEVNSAKETSHTSIGFSQVTDACGGLGLNREGLFTSGVSLNGHFLLTSDLNFFIISIWVLSLKPVPTLPVYTNSFWSNTPRSREENNLPLSSFFVYPPITISCLLFDFIFNQSSERQPAQ